MQFLNLEFMATKVSDGVSRFDVSGSTTEGMQEASIKVLQSEGAQVVGGADCFETVFLHLGNSEADQKEGFVESAVTRLQEQTRPKLSDAMGKNLWSMRSIYLRGNDSCGSVEAFVTEIPERSSPELPQETEPENQTSLLPNVIVDVGTPSGCSAPLMIPVGLDVHSSGQALESQADWTFEETETEETAPFTRRGSEALGQNSIRLSETGPEYFETKVETPERSTDVLTDVPQDFGSGFQMESLTPATQKTSISPEDSGTVLDDDALNGESSSRSPETPHRENLSQPQMTYENLGVFFPSSEEGDGVSTITTDFRSISAGASPPYSAEQLSKTGPILPSLKTESIKEVKEGRNEAAGQTRLIENVDELKQVATPVKSLETLPANGFPATVFEGMPSTLDKHEAQDVSPNTNDGATVRTSENQSNRPVADLVPSRPNLISANAIQSDALSGGTDQIGRENVDPDQISEAAENAKFDEANITQVVAQDATKDALTVNIATIEAAPSETKDLLSYVDEFVSGVTPTKDHDVARGLTAPTSAAKGAEFPTRVAMQIADAARQLPDRPVEITLTPEELGRVRLSFQIPENGPMQVVIAAERPETLDLLRRNIDSLIGEFKDLGYVDSGFSFQSFDQGGQEEKASTSASLRAARSDAIDELPIIESPTPVRLSLGKHSGMDLRL